MYRPVFLIGCPRSGTTITLRLMSMHKAFAWVSQYQNRFPGIACTALLHRVYDLPLVGNRLRLRTQRRLPRALEPWRFWTTNLRRFRQLAGGPEPPREHRPEDMTEAELQRVRRIVRGICRWQGKRRFLTKYTEFSRILYMRKAFPDARFVHIVRDARAVVNSFHEKVHKGQFGNWDERDWWAALFPEPWRGDFYERHHTPVGLLAYLWKYFVGLIRREAASLPPEQYTEVRYAKLVRDPLSVLERTLEFCGLPLTNQFRWCVERTPVSSMDHKWKQRLEADQKRTIHEIVGEDEFRDLMGD